MQSWDINHASACDKHTYTHASTGVEQEAGFTDALEAAVVVDTQSVEAHVSDQTLVHVCGRTEEIS